MKPNRVLGSRRHHGATATAGASPRTSSLPSPIANDDEGDQGGTPEDVRQSNDAAMRGCIRQLASLLSNTSSVALEALGEDGTEYYGALRAAADTLWSVVR